MANLQTHKLQLHPTKNVSGGVYDATNGNDGTSILIKHNALVDAIETKLTILEEKEKVITFFFDSVPSYKALIPPNFQANPITITKVMTHSESEGMFGLHQYDGNNSLALFTSNNFVNFVLGEGYNWVTHTIIDNPVIPTNSSLFISTPSNITDAVMHIYYI